MIEKKCSKCGFIKSIDNVYKNKSKKDGYQNWCKSCKKEFDDKYYIKNKEKFIKRNKNKRHKRSLYSIELKENLKCEACGFGSPNHHMCLTFHHIKPNEKSFSISNAIRDMVKKESIENEIKKSKILCANCHSIITYYYNQYYHNKITKEEVYSQLKLYNLQDYLIL